MNYEFHPDAEREFIEEAAHYAEVPGLGSQFVGEVDRAIELLRVINQCGAWLPKGAADG